MFVKVSAQAPQSALSAQAPQSALCQHRHHRAPCVSTGTTERPVPPYLDVGELGAQVKLLLLQLRHLRDEVLGAVVALSQVLRSYNI